MSERKDGTTDFGFQQVPEAEKAGRVAAVFSSVARRYDVMNDLMSLGVHRAWKRFAIELAGVRPGERVLDLAGGTGDLAAPFARAAGPDGLTVLADINRDMLEQGRARLADRGVGGLPLVQADAQALPFAERSFDCLTIAFGLRNVTDKQAALRSMLRVLKPGGRLLVLEFSKPRGPALSRLYDEYSFRVLPWLGRVVANDEAAYRYLAESIRMHPDQETLKGMMQDAGFARCQVYDLTGGIVAVHRGFRPPAAGRSPAAAPGAAVTGAAPGFVVGGLEIALNRALRMEPDALAECARLADRVIALHAAGPGWNFFLAPHAGGVQVLDAAPRPPDVRISAPVVRVLARALAGQDLAAGGVQVEGDAELLARFRTLLAGVGFDAEEWLAPWLGAGAAHRVGQGARALLGWARRSAGTLALDTAEYLREETGDLAHRADAEAWMDGVDALRERVDRLAARLERVARKAGA